MQLKWPMLWDLFSLFPAHAGVIQILQAHGGQKLPFPRTRGGDPVNAPLSSRNIFFSPHTRG